MLLAILLFAILLPITGFGQGSGTPKSNYSYYGVHIWDESSSQADQYKLKSTSHTINMLDWNGTPFYFFTASTCSKFSLRILGYTDEPNSTCCGTSVPLKWQFYKPDGTLYAEYLEPETNIAGEWEPNYGNFSTYTSGITPDFQITESGVYYLKCMEFYNGTWNPANPNNGNNSIKINIVPEGFSDYTINAPDNACFGELLCWSIEPFVDPSMIISSNWPYLANPCTLVSTTTPNEIIVSIKNWCNDEITTISKSINIVDFQDFTLANNVCINQTVNVGDITQCDGTHNIISYEWNWGDGTTSNTRYSSHSYASPGTYTVRLTVVVDDPDNDLRTSTMAKPITVYSYPEAPTVSGVFNTCNNPGVFTIDPAAPNTSYTWNVNYSSAVTGSETEKNITWNTTTFPNAPSYATINVTATSNGCSTPAEFKVYRCCTGTNPNLTYNGGAIITSKFPDNAEVFINGTIFIDADITQQSTRFAMGPNAKIIVNPGHTFEIETSNSRLYAGCDYMWDGIYVDGVNSTVNIESVPQISGALNAINSTNGGKFFVAGSVFYDNYICIKVSSYHPSLSAANHSGLVYASTFKNVNNMIAPYAGQKSYTGIYTDEVYNLTIGDISGGYNTFDNVFCGVQSYNSYLTLIKNNFININRSPACTGGESDGTLTCETAVHVAKKYYVYNTYDPIVTLGTSNRIYNNFTNCDRGYYGYKAKQTIQYNYFTNVKKPISCRDFTSNSSISYNNISNTPRGIYVVYNEPAVSNLLIEGNVLSNITNYGIWLTNCKSHATLSYLKVKVLNNNIYYNSSMVAKGIYASNCDYLTAKDNTVSNAALVTSTVTGKNMRGICIENCPYSLLKHNKFYNMGTGIYPIGLQNGTKFQCNEFSQNFYGFYLAAGLVFDPIGTAANPDDNKWTANNPNANSYRVSGDANNITPKCWYYKNTVEFNPNIVSPNPVHLYVIPTVSGSTAPEPCSSAKGDGDNAITENIDSTTTMEGAIPETVLYASQMRYMYMSFLFNNNPEQYDTEITQAEQGLYDNIPLIAKINKFAACDTTIDRAIALNNSLIPLNEMETYRKFVNDICLSYVAKGISPSAALIDELTYIANLSPLSSGEAVHIARALLNLEPYTLSKQDVIMPFSATSNSNIQWYPNPANDVLNISSNENFVSGSKIELYDITGRMVYSNLINTESNNTSISLKEIKQGLYLCVIKNGEEIISSSKISVVKQ